MQIVSICSEPFLKIRIAKNGELTFCKHQSLSLGNLYQSNFDEIWFGETADEIRVQVMEGDFHLHCQQCPLFTSRSPKINFEYREYPVFLILETIDSEIISKIEHVFPNLAQVHFLNIEDALRVRLGDELRIRAETDGKNIPIDEWLKIPRSLLVFHLNYVGAALSGLYELSRKVGNQQILQINNVVNENMYEAFGLIHIAQETGAQIEFGAPDYVNEQNCGIFYKLQQDIIAECNARNVAFSFKSPLDKGLTNGMLI